MYNIPDFCCLILHQADGIDFLSKTESCIWQFTLLKFNEIRTLFCSLCLTFFHLRAQKLNLKKKKFIQTNSFIIFACPNPVLLVKGFGGLAQRLLLYIYKLTLIPIFCISRIKWLVIFGKICTTFEILPIFRHFGLF